MSASPRVDHRYVPTLATWATISAIIAVFEANAKYAARLAKEANTSPQERCDRALGLIIPRLEVLEQQLGGSTQAVTAPRNAAKGMGIERLRDVARGL